MLTIRLQRTGKRNASDFRVVLAEKESHVSKKTAEVLGSYNPKTKILQIKDQARLDYWIGQRVEMSPTVHNLMVTKGVLKADKVKAFTTPKKEVAAAEAPSATPTAAETVPPNDAPAEEPAPQPTEELAA